MKILWLFFLLTVNSVSAEEVTVTLLGTGTPRPSAERFGPAVLIEFEGEKFLFDVGRGATIRLEQVGLNPSDINHLFLTHLHSDHISGYADFWMTGWIWQRDQALRVYGPDGTWDFVHHTKQAFHRDIAYRVSQTGLSESALQTKVVDIPSEGVLFESDNVTITAFRVEHGAVKPAYGYKVDAGGRVIVISGDTTLSENLIEHAKGADLLIHEFAAIRPSLLASNPKLKKISQYHSSFEDIKLVLDKSNVKRIILTHLLIIGYEEHSLGQLLSSQLGEKVVLGQDLMQIKIN
jgi:ribonuclease Z